MWIFGVGLAFRKQCLPGTDDLSDIVFEIHTDKNKRAVANT